MMLGKTSSYLYFGAESCRQSRKQHPFPHIHTLTHTNVTHGKTRLNVRIRNCPSVSDLGLLDRNITCQQAISWFSSFIPHSTPPPSLLLGLLLRSRRQRSEEVVLLLLLRMMQKHWNSRLRCVSTGLQQRRSSSRQPVLPEG